MGPFPNTSIPVTSSSNPVPTGTVTFLFTDIEGSTKLWETQREATSLALARHDALLRQCIEAHGGHVVKTLGDGFHAAFAVAPDALAAAFAAQRALNVEPWPAMVHIRVRMALHTGTAELRDGDYYGPTLNRAARLLATGHGGQTLLSQATFELTRDSLPDAVCLRELGAHQLKDLARPEQVYELQHPDLPGNFPPIKSLSTHPNNLPQQLTSFIGREKEIVEIEALLARTRVVTLTGSGGSGKTRLGLQVAADSLARYPDGAWFVELAALSEPGLVTQTVASVLGLKEAAGEPIIRTLTEHLKHKQLLLLLDNCEHLVDACATLADVVVRQCPGVRVLATSREALGITGEQTYRVPSLSLPDRKQAPTPQSLSIYESVQLFIDRALLVRSDFQVSNQNAPALASLCCQLDGIPLAIELAAARVRSLSVEEIDGKLDQRFSLLTGGSRIALPRQQTLRSLIDWSFDLLREPEKLFLQRLSVFAGGWTLAAAEAVCAGEGIEQGDVLDLLTSLADKSLVVPEQKDAQTRWRLLETVRQYARDRLEDSGGGAAIHVRHRDYYLALAEEADPKLRGAEQAGWLRRLEEEHENLRVGLAWSLAEGEPRGGLRLCGALQRFWGTRGHFSEGRQWCTRVLGKAGAEERTRERAYVLNAAGVLANLQGDYPAARALHEQSVAIRRVVGDRFGMAGSLGNLGIVALNQGDYPAARALYEESLAIVRELGDRSGIAKSLCNLGNVAQEQGDYPAARTLHEESLAIHRELGDRSGIATSLGGLGIVAFEQGDYPAARALYEQSLAIERELEDRFGIASSLCALGSVALYQGDYPTARALLEESLAMRRELGARLGISISLVNLGNVALHQGDHPAARALYEESLAIFREIGERWGIPYSLEGLAAVVASLRDSLRAARIWGATERLRAEIGTPLPPNQRPGYDRRVAAARIASGDDAAFDSAWQEGRCLTLDQAIDLALTKPVEGG
jgi:predicted ATPase/class 3 adenylate cyclase